MTRVEKAACRSCHGGCGAIVTLEDDRVVKIQPDPDSPLSRGRMCPKGLAGVELLYHPKRLKYPMKRAGARGEGKWQRISWDEAYDIIAENVESIEKQYGIEGLGIATGTGRHHFYLVPRFANTLGTPNWFEPGTAQCFFPRIMASVITYGHQLVCDYYSEVNPEVMLVWGHNPVVSGADCEVMFRARDAMNKGSRMIVVDPRRTEMAERAEVWLQLRPGTDDALALGMLHVIINEALYDKDFVTNWCVGFDELKERVAQYTPARVAEITWVPEEKIVAAARLYAGTKAGTLEWGCAIEHTPNCFATVRAIAMIPGLCGHYDVKGGFIKGSDCLPGASFNDEKLGDVQEKKRLGYEAHPLLARASEVNGMPGAHVPSVLDAIRTGKPYPVRGLMLFGNNGLMAFAQTDKTLEAIKSLDFMCTMDLFMTPTAEWSDVILPAASWMEMDQIYAGPYGAAWAVLCQKKLTRTYECKSDEEVFVELSKRLGRDYGAEKDTDIYDGQLAAMAERYPQFAGMTFEKLKELNYLEVPIEYRQYEKNGRLDTPTGKMELYSATLAKFGLDPLPEYAEPPESPLSRPDLYEDYPLVLTTGGRYLQYFISENRQVRSLRERHPYPTVEMHPNTAARYGIADGDWVFIESPRGRITQKALVTSGIDERVVNCRMGFWYPEVETPDHGFIESNVNVLTCQEPPYDAALGTYQLRSLLCRISKNDDDSIERRFEAAREKLYGEPYEELKKAEREKAGP